MNAKSRAGKFVLLMVAVGLAHAAGYLMGSHSGTSHIAAVVLGVTALGLLGWVVKIHVEDREELAKRNYEMGFRHGREVLTVSRGPARHKDAPRHKEGPRKDGPAGAS